MIFSCVGTMFTICDGGHNDTIFFRLLGGVQVKIALAPLCGLGVHPYVIGVVCEGPMARGG